MKNPIYRDKIRNLAENRISLRVSNGEPAHAAALFEAMFETAEDKICIFSRSLSAEVFEVPKVMESLHKFLNDPKTKLQVLIQKENEVYGRPIAELLSASHSGEPDIRIATGNYAMEEAKHFAVMDERAFRFELLHDKKSALADFNDPTSAHKLQQMFDVAFKNGQRTQLSAFA